MGISVTEVNARAEIAIRTLFSDYNFRVTDPVQCRGFLSGGQLGNEPHDAFFAGAIPPAGSKPCESTRFETGHRAVFLVGGDDVIRLTTSIITEINLSETPAEVC